MTVFTWGLTFSQFNGGNIYPQMYYYNSVTKERKTSGAVPEEGLNLHHTGSGIYSEIKFMAELEDYDMVMFKLKGKYSGEYTLTSERVERL